MNSSFFNKFYFLTKLTTTLVLFSAVLFLGYLLVKSYKANNEESYTIIIDKKITALSHSIEDYSQKIISINQKISDNERSLSLINKEFNSNFLDVKFDELLKENQNLQEQITNLSNLVNLSENKDYYYNEDKDTNSTVSNLINLIELKYENGSNINAELLLLQNQIADDSKQAYFEKLFILSDQNSLE